MMTSLQSLPWEELVIMLAERSDLGWLGVVCQSSVTHVLFERVCGIVAATDGDVCAIERVESADMLLGCTAGESRSVVIAGLDALSEAEWKSLDLFRERLKGHVPWTLLMDLACAERFLGAAPHLFSMMGVVVEVELELDALSPTERSAMIATFEKKSGMTSAELEALASVGKRPGGADYVAWLVLLGKGELL